jgi:hypothetical protein
MFQFLRTVRSSSQGSPVEVRRLPRREPQAHRTRLRVETLEERTLLAVVPIASYQGLNSNDDPRYRPPDTNVAVGRDEIVETINSSIVVLDKGTGHPVSGFPMQTLQTFFARPGTLIHSAVVTYLDQVDPLHGGRFIVAAMDFPDSGGSLLDFALSNDGHPQNGFTQMYQIMVTTGNAFGVDPKIGWNADAVVIALSIFGDGDAYAQVYSIDINDLTHNMLTYSSARLPATDEFKDFTVAPATMHGSVPGDPMWLVGRAKPGDMPDGRYHSYNGIALIQMNVLGPITFTVNSLSLPYPMDTYWDPPDARQPRNDDYSPSPSIYTGDSRMMNAAFLKTPGGAPGAGRLVVCFTAAPWDPGPMVGGSFPQVHWYELGVAAGVAPFCTQGDPFDQSNVKDSYYPAIDINSAGDLGLTYMQSSDQLHMSDGEDGLWGGEYMSMYITGQCPADGIARPNHMSAGFRAHHGVGIYSGWQAGNYAGIGVDPTDDSFWAGNMYKGTAYWNTGIANFTISCDLGLPAGGIPVGAETAGREAAGENQRFVMTGPVLVGVTATSASPEWSRSDAFFAAGSRRDGATALPLKERTTEHPPTAQKIDTPAILDLALAEDFLSAGAI